MSSPQGQNRTWATQRECRCRDSCRGAELKPAQSAFETPERVAVGASRPPPRLPPAGRCGDANLHVIDWLRRKNRHLPIKLIASVESHYRALMSISNALSACSRAQPNHLSTDDPGLVSRRLVLRANSTWSQDSEKAKDKCRCRIRIVLPNSNPRTQRTGRLRGSR